MSAGNYKKPLVTKFAKVPDPLDSVPPLSSSLKKCSDHVSDTTVIPKNNKNYSIGSKCDINGRKMIMDEGASSDLLHMEMPDLEGQPENVNAWESIQQAFRTDFSSDNIEIKRSNTDTSLQYLRTTDLQESSDLSKSHSILSTKQILTKRRSYDPIEARKYIKEQKLKRIQSRRSDPVAAGAVDRETIKTRLLELSTKARKILKNNIKRLNKKESHNQRQIDQSERKKTYSLEQEKTIKNNIEPTCNVTSNKSEGMCSTIGDINSNIEKSSPTTMDKRTQSEVIIPQTDFPVKLNSLKKDVSEGNNDDNTLNEMILSVPESSLKSKTVAAQEKSIQVGSPPTNKNNRFSDWLNPTPVELYPYNFIVAVRKKLEAITGQTEKIVYPEITAQASIKRDIFKKSSATNRSEDSSTISFGTVNRNPNKCLASSFHKTKSFSKIYEKSPHESIHSNKATKESSGSLSELTSNFSSITVSVPKSDTFSAISSVRSDFSPNVQVNKEIGHEDDTTVSSSVFSSPEKQSKKQTVYNYNSNHNSNGENHNKKESTVSEIEADNLIVPSVTLQHSGLLTPITELSINTTLNSTSLTLHDLKFLDGFNRDLSHVIKVKNQLKSPLKKLNLNEAYSSDFDDDISYSKSDVRNLKIASMVNSSPEDSPDKTLTNSDLQNNGKVDNNSALKETSDTENNEKLNGHATNSLKSITFDEIPELPSNSTNSGLEELITASVNGDDQVKTLSLSDRTMTEIEIVIEHEVSRGEASNKEGNNIIFEHNSRNSIYDSPTVISKNSEYFKTHVNTLRGNRSASNSDVMMEACKKSSLEYSTKESMRISQRSLNSSSVESDAIGRAISESFDSTLSYSTIGAYEQLLKSETRKSEYLAALLKIREKNIRDRTKAQITWLEIQKEKLKMEGGKDISAIKKKQRGVLMKLEKEQEEIKRVLKCGKEQPTERIRQNLTPPKFPEDMFNISFRRMNISPGSNSSTSNKSRTLVRGFELEMNHNLEVVLKRREEELKRRRAHVEKLLQWHDRLEREEREVSRMEKLVFDRCLYHKSISTPDIIHTQKKIEKINESLRDLQNIPGGSNNSGVKKNDKEYVYYTGKALNKLWRRLTGRKETKYEMNTKYKLVKKDIENLYEEAKDIVLNDFAKKDEMKDDGYHQSRLNNICICHHSSRICENSQQEIISNLNFNFSSTQSDTDKSFISLNITKGNFSTLSVTVQDKFDSVAETRNNFNCPKLNNENGSYDGDLVKQVNAANSNGNSGEIVVENSSIDKCLNEVSLVKGDENLMLLENKCEDGTYTESFDSSICGQTSIISGKEGSILSEQNNDTTFVSVVESNLSNVNVQSSNHNSFNSVAEEENSNSSFTSTFSPSSVPLPTDKNVKESTLSEPSSICENIEGDTSSVETLEQKQSLNNSDDVTETENSESSTLANGVEEQIMNDEPETSKEQYENCNSSFKSSTDYESAIDDHFSMTEQKDQMIQLSEPTNENLSSQISENELEKRLTDIQEGLRNLHLTFEGVSSPEKQLQQRKFPIRDLDDDDDGNKLNSNQKPSTIRNHLVYSESPTGLMPDIISEVELRRRQHMLFESEIRQLEHEVPYVFLREIPNKPPPPYVPPAHGSPMTAIFPSEKRIKEITFRRIKELYEEINNGNSADQTKKTVSILDENITNIYERIILDICKEKIEEYKPSILNSNPKSYLYPLVLFNSSKRMQSLQNIIYKHIRKVLAMDKRTSNRNSVYDIGRRKCDQVDEILIQELIEEEFKWTNFDIEEEEVRLTVMEEFFNKTKLVDECSNDPVFPDKNEETQDDSTCD